MRKGNPHISGISRLVKYYNLARWMMGWYSASVLSWFHEVKSDNQFFCLLIYIHRPSKGVKFQPLGFWWLGGSNFRPWKIQVYIYMYMFLHTCIYIYTYVYIFIHIYKYSDTFSKSNQKTAKNDVPRCVSSTNFLVFPKGNLGNFSGTNVWKLVSWKSKGTHAPNATFPPRNSRPH